MHVECPRGEEQDPYLGDLVERECPCFGETLLRDALDLDR